MTHEEQTGKYGRRFLGWDVQEDESELRRPRLTATPLYLGYSWTGRPKLFKGTPVRASSEDTLQRYMQNYVSPPPPSPSTTGFRPA